MSETEQTTAEPTELEAPVSDSPVEPAPDEESPTDEPEGPETGAEGEDEPVTEAPKTPEELEADRAKLARSATNWRNRVSDVLGEDAQFLVVCELCEPDIPGFHFPPELVTPANETHARLLDVLRAPEAVDYVPAPDVTRCEACNGYGQTRTGSRVPTNELKVCSECNGFGYTPPPGSSSNGRSAQPADLAAVSSAAPDIPLPESDAWGSPRLLPDGRDNPNFGRMPQYKVAAYP